MIRINLLGTERERPKKREHLSSFEASGQKITLACTLILVVAAAGVAWWYWSLQKESTRLADDLAYAQQASGSARPSCRCSSSRTRRHS